MAARFRATASNRGIRNTRCRVRYHVSLFSCADKNPWILGRRHFSQRIMQRGLANGDWDTGVAGQPIYTVL